MTCKVCNRSINNVKVFGYNGINTFPCHPSKLGLDKDIEVEYVVCVDCGKSDFLDREMLGEDLDWLDDLAKKEDICIQEE